MGCGCQRVEIVSRSRAAAAGVGPSPERPSIRVEIIAVSNTQCCMRGGTQSAAQGEANPSFLRFRVSGSPCSVSIASTRDNFHIDVACGRGSFLVWPSLSKIAWGKEGGGAGGGNLGVLLVPAPVELPAGPRFLTQPIFKFTEVILVFVLQSACWAPAGGTPVSKYFQSWTSSLRARATIPIRRCRLLPLPKRA
jgi:hypothetical protein